MSFTILPESSRGRVFVARFAGANRHACNVIPERTNSVVITSASPVSSADLSTPHDPDVPLAPSQGSWVPGTVSQNVRKQWVPTYRLGKVGPCFPALHIRKPIQQQSNQEIGGRAAQAPRRRISILGNPRWLQCKTNHEQRRGGAENPILFFRSSAQSHFRQLQTK